MSGRGKNGGGQPSSGEKRAESTAHYRGKKRPRRKETKGLTTALWARTKEKRKNEISPEPVKNSATNRTGRRWRKKV